MNYLKEKTDRQGIITLVNIRDVNILEELRHRIRKGLRIDNLPGIDEALSLNNIIVDAGLTVEAMRKSGDKTYTGEINYGALGDGSTAVSASDTQMENEIYRSVKSDASYDGKTCFVDFFYDKSEVSGDFTRFANFIDGTSDPDTGQMWTHLAVNWSKTDDQGLFISCQYDISYKS